MNRVKTPLDAKKMSSVQISATWSMFLNRIFVCLLAVIFLWITTLQLAVDITKGYISVPALSYITSSCDNAYQTVKKQREEYEACAARQTTACDIELESTYQSELARVESVQRGIADMLLAAQMREAQCSTHWTSLHSSVLAYKDPVVQNRETAVLSSADPSLAYDASAPTVVLQYNPQCSFTQISKLRSLLDDVVVEGTLANMTRQERSGQLDAYSRRSDNRVIRMAQHVKNVNTYNVQYVSNKTQYLQTLSRQVLQQVTQVRLPGMDLQLQQIKVPLSDMLACFGVKEGQNRTTINATCSIPELLDIDEAYRAMQREAQAGAQQAREAVAQFQDELEVFTSAVQSALARADALFASIAGATGIITWLVDNADVFSINADACGHGEPDWCSFSPVEWDVPMIYPPKLPVFSDVPDASFLWEGVSKAIRSMNVGVEIGSLGVRDSLTELVDSVDISLATDIRFRPDDYNPPQYPQANADEHLEGEDVEVANQTQDSDEFRDNVADLYADVDAENASAAAALEVGNSTVNSPSYTMQPFQTLQQQLASTFTGEWASFNPGKVDTKIWLSAFDSLQSFLFFFDYIYRSLQTIMIVKRHWGRSAAALPPIDLRADKTAMSPSKNAQMILNYADFIGMQFLVVLTIVGIIAYSLAASYMQSYDAYNRACVVGDRNSTFLMRSANSLAYNYASSEGNGDIADALHSYNLRSSELCGQSGPSTQRAYETMYQQMQEVNNTFYTSASQVGLTEACLDHNDIDQLYSTLCCDSSAAYSRATSEQLDELRSTCQQLSPGSTQSSATAALNCPAHESTGAVLLPPSAHLGKSACDGRTWPLAGMTPFNFSTAMASQPSNSTVRNATSPAFSCQTLPMCSISCR